MSGVEVIGLLSSAISIVDTLLYAQKSIHSVRHAPNFAQDLAIQLSVQRLILVNTISVVLKEADVTQTDIEKSADVADLGAPIWTDPEVETKLKTFLGEYYERFVVVLKDMISSLADLKRKLEKYIGVGVTGTNKSISRRRTLSFGLGQIENDFRKIGDRQKSLDVIIQSLIQSGRRANNIEDELKVFFEQLGRNRQFSDTTSIWSVETEVDMQS